MEELKILNDDDTITFAHEEQKGCDGWPNPPHNKWSFGSPGLLSRFGRHKVRLFEDRSSRQSSKAQGEAKVIKAKECSDELEVHVNEDQVREDLLGT
ncbi:hypothetical protein Tco_0511906 [Tanacetum coccineum]